MEKIYIRGFGPIKEAEIEIRKFLVMIGEQASGKSTIAKLIYFFKSIPNLILEGDIPQLGDHLYRFTQNPSARISTEYRQLLGGMVNQQEYVVKYFFDDERNIEIRNDTSDSLIIIVSEKLQNGLQEVSQLALEFKNLSYEDQGNRRRYAYLFHRYNEVVHLLSLMATKLYDSFGLKPISSAMFFPAGREASISYQFVFDSFFRGEFRTLRNKASKEIPTGISANDSLLLAFLDHVDRIKASFSTYGNFDSLFKALNHAHTNLIDNRVSGILKGRFQSNSVSEGISIEGKIIDLPNSSSGQKEVIRILQDIALEVGQNSDGTMRIIEEPEAHLFPVAQKHLIELLALLANHRPENQIIITTHSPYVLTVLNNLLLATRVVAKNPAAEEEVSKVVPAPIRLDPADFAAYSLGNSFDEDEPYCANILSPETGMISQNYLDTVSDLLGMEFDYLRDIHLRSFQRHGS